MHRQNSSVPIFNEQYDLQSDDSSEDAISESLKWQTTKKEQGQQKELPYITESGQNAVQQHILDNAKVVLHALKRKLESIPSRIEREAFRTRVANTLRAWSDVLLMNVASLSEGFVNA